MAMATVHLFLRNILLYNSLQPLFLLYFSRDTRTLSDLGTKALHVGQHVSHVVMQSPQMTNA